jgi:type II secretory ATPase GspE/PulE/Tfp pilus assembly ATPase PilB-like protein
MILNTGPTGSGKTTTLYAFLKYVQNPEIKIITIENPIEYHLPGIVQTQTSKGGLSFVEGLRSIVRQDPDVIMVGEIRDKETAQLAIQAALTGHLVFSTIHTNNSIGVIPRLIDMGVDPYLIAPTLKLAIAQRLARRICPGTGKETEVNTATRMMMDDAFETLPEKYRTRIPQNNTILHPEPSPGCTTGTKGRVAVMEIFEVDEAIQELILKGGSEEEMFSEARKNGFMSVKEDAIVKALEHVIPIEEVNTFGTKVATEEPISESEVVSTPEVTVTDVVKAESSAPVDNPKPESLGNV